MVSTDGIGARWVALLLAGALVASGVVVYLLVRLTEPVGVDSGTVVETVTNEIVSTSSSGTPTDSSSSPPPVSTSSTSTEPDPSTTEDTVESTPATEETRVTLTGSDVVVPAAWSGTAELTITVLGECANGASSHYTTTADLALGDPLVAADGRAEFNPVWLSLGVQPTGVPSLALYSSATDNDGRVHRYWSLIAHADAQGRTELTGRLVGQAQPGSGEVNLLSDAETEGLACNPPNAVSLPRPLGAGSALRGWVSEQEARIEIEAVTTDGERTVTAVLTLERVQ